MTNLSAKQKSIHSPGTVAGEPKAGFLVRDRLVLREREHGELRANLLLMLQQHKLANGALLVFGWTENPRAGGSIPPPAPQTQRLN